MHLGTLIARFREEERMSMDEFASRSGLSKAYISMLERNVNSKWCKSGANEHKKEPPSRAADILSGTLR
jgi:transcriptional regulator with XRE-family HTH domain